MSFPEEVLKEVTAPLNNELTEFLFLLLTREEQDGFRAILGNYTPKERVDVYAHSLNEFFKHLPKIYETGFKVQIDTLLKHYEPEFVQNSYSTFWTDLKGFLVPIRFPHSLRKEHSYILGSSGSGKTQLIQQLISQDLDTSSSIIVIDSQGDLIKNLKYSKLIDPERLVIVDPIDSVEHPLALNMFDIGQSEMNLDPVSYERHMNGVVETLNFVFSAVMDSPLTDKQGVVFGFCIRLMLLVPRATILSLVDVLENGVERYQKYIRTMPDISQSFFRSAFPESARVKNEYRETKTQIIRRLYSLLQNPTISRIFKSSKNRFNLSKEMDSGKVILISTDISLLKKQGCAFFGRYFLSQISQAMLDRLNRPQIKRRKTYVYVDECGDYLSSDDVNITDILEKGRKFNVGLTLAHQHTQQLPPNVFQSIRSNTSIKFVGSCSAGDARIMKGDMRNDFLHNMPKLKFCAYTRGSSTSLTVKVKPGIIEDSEQRTDEELEAIMQVNRAKYCVDYEIPDYSPAIPVKDEINEEKPGIPEDPLAPYT